METKDYVAVCKEFDMMFPHVYQALKELENEYRDTFKSRENSPIKQDNVSLIGKFVLDEKYRENNDIFLPPIRFEKLTELSNPYFYLITTPDNIPLYIGSSLDDVKIKTCSASTITGGLPPKTESRQGYCVYLGLLCFFKIYGYFNVYEIKTGYENIKIKNLDGDLMPKKTISKKMAYEVFSHVMTSMGKLPIINDFNGDEIRLLSYRGTTKPEGEGIVFASSLNIPPIISAVFAYKELKKQTPAKPKSDKSILERYKDDKWQKITVKRDADGYLFTFEKHVDIMTFEEESRKKEIALEKLIPRAAKVLCQPGKSTDDQYASYVSHQVKNGGRQDVEFDLATKQEQFINLEKTIVTEIPSVSRIEYRNIHVGDLKHYGEYGGVPRMKHSIRFSWDGTNSAIKVYTDSEPSFQNIKNIIDSIKTLFNLTSEDTEVEF